jgi:hypothetical protein
MPVRKHYTAAEVKSAMDTANGQYYRQLLRGRGSDVGHALRHVPGTVPAGKNIYRDAATAVAVTLELLNSASGQAALGRLDGENPDGDGPGMEANRQIVAAVAGAHYGAAGTGQPWKKIATAACEVMKLGEDTLWIRSTYPSSFHS